ncbi:hypothetical protein PFISCL1PPCAC_2692, partial [Pristionchus fissidentatus]
MCYESPMIESLGSAYCENIREPRVFKTHLTYQETPRGGGAKYIFAVRNPKDCLTSYFHHHRNFKHYLFDHGEFDTFYELFMAGEVGYGDYFDYLNGWLEGIKKGEENVLLIKYEDMVADLCSSVFQIANFIGGRATEIIDNDHVLNRVIEASSISAMKKNQRRWFPQEMLNGDFIRKGGSGDWKNYFSEEQSRSMDARFNERLASTVADDWWKEVMAF